MRRHQIQLLAAARDGNAEARCRVGRHYLLGDGGFPRHVATGLDYLKHPSVSHLPCAWQAISDGLSLHELLRAGLLERVELAARAGHAGAALHCAAWEACCQDGADRARSWLLVAAAAGSEPAQRALAARTNASGDLQAAASTLATLATASSLDPQQALDCAAARAAESAQVDALIWTLQLGASLHARLPATLRHHVVTAIDLAEASGRTELAIPVSAVESALSLEADGGNARAVFHLARALSSLPCGRLPPTALVARPNARKGAALLLRAADAGEARAWLHLHRVSAEHRSSVANPQLARFCLEKAAAAGQARAQLRLGVLLMRESTGPADSERALGWIHSAHRLGEELALAVMQSLVLPVDGDETRAVDVLRELSRSDAWLTARLSLARHFGLTRLEALCIDPPSAMRPWGLVVGSNPHVSKPRLAAARAVPAITEQATECLRGAASLFAHRGLPDRERPADLQSRKRRLRLLLAQFGAPEDLFFARATATTLDALRRGPRWASRARATIAAVLDPGEPMLWRHTPSGLS